MGEVITLNTLSDGTTTIALNHVIWTNRKNGARVPGSEHRTLGGVTIVQRLNGVGVPEIILEGILDGQKVKGYFLWSDACQFEIWRDEGSSLKLKYDGEEHNVIIPMDGVNMRLIFPRCNPKNSAKCVGTLRLV